MEDRLERIKALEEAFKSDEAFAANFKRAVEARSVDDTIALAASKGIELTQDDFAPEAAALEGKELDDAELEAVAGGYSWDEFMSDVHCVFMFLLAGSV